MCGVSSGYVSRILARMARCTEDLTLDLAEGVTLVLVVALVVCLRLGLGSGEGSEMGEREWDGRGMDGTHSFLNILMRVVGGLAWWSELVLGGTCRVLVSVGLCVSVGSAPLFCGSGRSRSPRGMCSITNYVTVDCGHECECPQGFLLLFSRETRPIY